MVGAKTQESEESGLEKEVYAHSREKSAFQWGAQLLIQGNLKLLTWVFYQKNEESQYYGADQDVNTDDENLKQGI